MTTPFQPQPDELFVADMRRALRVLPDAPPAWLNRAIALWAPAPAVGLVDVARAAVRLVQAVLTFDSWASTPLAAGMRGSRIPTRHYLFNAEGRDIDLRVTPAAAAYALSGQILGPDERGAIELRGVGDASPVGVSVELDALGEFHLADVPPGFYVLTLALADARIVLPPVQVGGSQGAAQR